MTATSISHETENGDLQFVDELPSTPSESRRNWRAIGDRLRAHPGKWAIVASYKNPGRASNSAWTIKAGRVSLGGGKFDAVSRTTEDGKHVVYARFLGDEEAA